MCVRTQRSSEEAFRFFGKNFSILGRSLPVCGGVAPQTHFGKAFRIAASILKTRTVGAEKRDNFMQELKPWCKHLYHLSVLVCPYLKAHNESFPLVALTQKVYYVAGGQFSHFLSRMDQLKYPWDTSAIFDAHFLLCNLRNLFKLTRLRDKYVCINRIQHMNGQNHIDIFSSIHDSPCPQQVMVSLSRVMREHWRTGPRNWLG